MVSIIVPVYNTEKNLLDRCVHSIVCQAFSDWELILVDDGSTKDVREYVDEYLKLDDRIRVIHQENKGVSGARNTGLRQAVGEYIGFVDGDDTVSQGYLRDAVGYMEAQNLDVVIGAAAVISKKSYEEVAISLPEGESIRIYDQEKVALVSAQMLEDCHIDGVSELERCRNGGPCWRLYKKSVLSGQEFCRDIFLLEDKIFNLYVFNNAKRIGICKDIWYNYYQYSTSAIHRFQPNLVLNCTAIVERCENILPRCAPSLVGSIQRFEVAQLSMLLQNFVCHMDNRVGAFQKLRQISDITSSVVWKETFKKMQCDGMSRKKRFLRYALLHRYNALLFIATRLFQLKTMIVK
ncbi:MAG: glycosyltransferase family 2 protein [Oscillospiraceae bacterium]